MNIGDTVQHKDGTVGVIDEIHDDCVHAKTLGWVKSSSVYLVGKPLEPSMPETGTADMSKFMGGSSGSP